MLFTKYVVYNKVKGKSNAIKGKRPCSKLAFCTLPI